MTRILLTLVVLVIPAAAFAQEAAQPTIRDLFMTRVLPDLIVVLGSGLALLAVWVRTKAGKAIASSKMSGAAKVALEWAASLAGEIVMAGVPVVSDWKQELADGKISQAEIDAKLGKLKAEALKRVQDATIGKLLGSGAAPTLSAALALTDTLVESAVAKVELAKPATVADPKPLPPPA